MLHSNLFSDSHFLGCRRMPAAVWMGTRELALENRPLTTQCINISKSQSENSSNRGELCPYTLHIEHSSSCIINIHENMYKGPAKCSCKTGMKREVYFGAKYSEIHTDEPSPTSWKNVNIMRKPCIQFKLLWPKINVCFSSIICKRS